MDEKNNYMKQTIINIILLTIAVIIIIIMLEGKKTENKIEVKVTLDKKPIVKNYHFTNPTVYKEKTIEYNTHEVITKEDSSRIVTDYLKERMYFDSIMNDTVKVRYHAIVSKNNLNDLKVDYSYRPLRIETKETKYRNGIFVGFSAGYITKPSVGFLGGFQTKNYTYGAMYDPLNKGGFLMVGRRIYLKK